MVSRRDFLLTNGTILAAAGLGFGFPGRAAAERDSPTPLLPSFGHATTLDVADVSSLHGDDQLLLTTLQGSSTGAALVSTSTTTPVASTCAGWPAPAPTSPATTTPST